MEKVRLNKFDKKRKEILHKKIIENDILIGIRREEMSVLHFKQTNRIYFLSIEKRILVYTLKLDRRKCDYNREDSR